MRGVPGTDEDAGAALQGSRSRSGPSGPGRTRMSSVHWWSRFRSVDHHGVLRSPRHTATVFSTAATMSVAS